MRMQGWERAELLAMQALQRQGYAVYRALPAVRRIRGELVSSGNDLFGLFDLAGLSAKDMRLVQVKCHERYRGPEREWLLKLSALPRPDNCTCEFWSLDPSGLWRIARWDAMGAELPVIDAAPR